MKTILIIEDEKQVSELMGTILDVEYFTVRQASGEEAIKTVGLIAPDLVILDIFLAANKLSGLDTLRALRALPQMTDVPIVAMSGRADRGLIDDALRLGATTFMSKPYSPMKLLQLVSELLKNDTPS